MMDLSRISPKDIKSLPDDQFEVILGEILNTYGTDRKVNQIEYYEPVAEKAMKVHESNASIVGIGGGNRSSKTTTVLVDAIARCTGVFPDSLKHMAEDKFLGPVNCRIVVESLTTTLHPVILPKLQWFTWTGKFPQGGPHGHWGWVPRDCLIDGDWEKSWSEKLRTLTVHCRDPGDRDKIVGKSKIQFMSHDQSPEDFASGDFHIVILDEPPPYAIYRETEARVMGVGGQIYLSMTWPDDPSLPVDWIFDEIFERARPGSHIEWHELSTLENQYIDQKAIREKMKGWDEATKAVRIHGKPIRFSNLVHPEFTDTPQVWSFRAGKQVVPDEGLCPVTGSDDLEPYCHVRTFDHDPAWPSVFIMDPHPRKPHMFMWVQVDPGDDWWVLAEGQVDAEPEAVAETVNRIERDMRIRTSRRIMDPNMGRSPSGKKRHDTWQDEFARCGLRMDLADDSDVGRARVNARMKPDPKTRWPRIHIHPRCEQTIYQLKRYAWQDYKRSSDRDMRQTPRDKHDDYPTMLKYLANLDPSFNLLKFGAPIIKKPRPKKGVVYGE